MAYIGNNPADIGGYAGQAETGNGVLTAFTLDRAATTASISISIDGVDQIPTTAYAVTVGTTLTFTSPPPNLSVISIRFLGDTVSFGEPSDDAVATAHIQDDAVTAAKLANSINTEIAANTAKTGITSGQASAITANTAKVTNATHTGDVTGATALTIATDAVDIAMLSATGTADATTFLRGDNSWVAPSGGLFASYAVVSDQVAQNNSMANITSGDWRETRLQTEVFDPDDIMTTFDGTGRIQMAPGTYMLRAFKSVYRGNNTAIRWWNHSSSTVVGNGFTTYLDAVHNFMQTLVAICRVTHVSNSQYSLQQQVASTTAGPGGNANFSVETYCYVEIYKENT